MGLERLSARPRLADPGRRVAQRRVRRPPRLLDRRGRLRCCVTHLRARAVDRGPGRGARPARDLRRLADAQRARSDRRCLPAGEGPLQGDRLLDRVVWHRVRHRAAVRRIPRRRDVVALDLRPERPVRRPDPAAGRLGPAEARAPRRASPVDYLGAALCALGLAGPVFALIRQPELGWGASGVVIPAVAGVGLFTTFLIHEARTPHPMLLLSLFKRRNFSIANIETLSMYGGLSIMLFVLVLFLQQVSGYDALHAGLATMPITAVMFVLSRRAGALADRIGPRFFMGAGPLLAAVGLLGFQGMGARFDYVTDFLPWLLLFSVGLSMTVAPLTATVLADADDHNAGIASGVNNAIARVAGLLAVAALGAVVASSFGSAIDSRLGDRDLSPAAQRSIASAKKSTLTKADVNGLTPSEAPAVASAVEHASVRAFHTGMGIAAALVGLGGLLGLAGIRNPRNDPHCADCPGGAMAGAPRSAGGTGDHEAVTAA